ncbi:MAG: ribonuclease P protein component [Dehalococcoidia bacterium]|nr:ribonuclease P protein component [Dehalococcoidia bacterium]
MRESAQPGRRPPERLRRRGDFALVMRTGRRARHHLFQVVARSTGEPVTRIGFSVGKQVGGAVVRNRLKRRLRMILRDLPWREGFHVVIIARPGSDSARFDELASALKTSAQRMGLMGVEDA